MNLPQDKIQKILIINLAFIGDVLLSTPVARALRQAFPQATIHIMTAPAAATVAKAIPFIDDVLVYDKRGKHKSFQGLWSYSRKLCKERYDLAVCTNFALRGAVLAWLSRIPYRIGYDAQHASFFLTHVASSTNREGLHEAQKYLAVLKPLSLTTDNTELALAVPEASKALGRKVLQKAQEKPLIVLCPYGSYRRKSLPDRTYEVLIRNLMERYYLCLIGGRQEAPDLASLQARTGLPKDQVFAGTADLLEISYLIERAEALLTVDTGPLHIAQAVKTPVIAFFGPTDPHGWGPRGERDIVFYDPVACSPCWGRGECREQICMKAISTETIMDALLSIIEVKNV